MSVLEIAADFNAWACECVSALIERSLKVLLISWLVIYFICLVFFVLTYQDKACAGARVGGALLCDAFALERCRDEALRGRLQRVPKAFYRKLYFCRTSWVPLGHRTGKTYRNIRAQSIEWPHPYKCIMTRYFWQFIKCMWYTSDRLDFFCSYRMSHIIIYQ